MEPGARFTADVILVAPAEREISRTQRTYREKNFTSFVEQFEVKSFQRDYVRRINEALGLEALATYLRADGVRTAVINCNVAPQSAHEIAEKVRTSGARVVGISQIYRPQVAQGLELLKALSGVSDIVVVFGGALASFMKHELLSRLERLDAIVFGESEETFRDFVRRVLDHQDYAELPGVAYRRNGKVVINTAGLPLKLAAVLAPQRDTLSYLRLLGKTTPIASIYTSRGCMAKCTFCTGKDVYNVDRGRTYRFRDPVHVVDEIEDLHRRFGVRFVYINDDNFLGYGQRNRTRIMTFADELIRRDLGIQFATECRVDSLDPEQLEMLRKAGMIQVLLGLESGAPGALLRWRKGATAEQNARAVHLLHDMRINTEPGFILFDAHTNRQELADNIAFIKQTRLDRTPFPTYLVNRLSIYPGSDIEKLSVLDGTIAPSKIAVGDAVRNAPADILEDFRRLEYTCRDARSEVAWRSLRYALEPIEQFVEDVLPIVTERLLAARNKNCGRSERRTEAIRALIHRSGSWRRGLGTLIVRMLEQCVASYDAPSVAAQMRSLRRSLLALRTDYDAEKLGGERGAFIDEVINFEQSEDHERGFFSYSA